MRTCNPNGSSCLIKNKTKLPAFLITKSAININKNAIKYSLMPSYNVHF